MGARTSRGFTLIELMIVIAIIAIVAAIAIPGLLQATRAANERNGGASLRTLVTAQGDFRANDRDGNKVPDFWTSDIFALYGLIPITAGATAPPGDSSAANDVIKLIEAPLGGADGASTMGLYGNVEIDNSIVVGSTKAGYLFRTFAGLGVGSAVVPLRSDTDGALFYYGAVHDRTRFAVVAFPVDFATGRLLFLVATEGTIYKYNLTDGYTTTYTPMTGTDSDSTSTFTGSGSALLDNATTFPSAPPAVGCSKLD